MKLRLYQCGSMAVNLTQCSMAQKEKAVGKAKVENPQAPMQPLRGTMDALAVMLKTGPYALTTTLQVVQKPQQGDHVPKVATCAFVVDVSKPIPLRKPMLQMHPKQLNDGNKNLRPLKHLPMQLCWNCFVGPQGLVHH